MKILVTGATGFIGRNIVEELRADGEEVFALVRETSKIDTFGGAQSLPFRPGKDRAALSINPERPDSVRDGSKNNESLVFSSPSRRIDFLRRLGVKFIYGDITDSPSLGLITGKFDAVFHCAAYVQDKDWKKLQLVNITGTENICKLCLRLEARRLVYLSSVSVVSGNFQVPMTEDLPYSATNLYGKSKIEAEKIVWDYRGKGLPSAILRPPMVYGEQEPHLLKFILFLIKHRFFPLIDGGKSKLHLVYVKNVAQAAVMALRNEGFLKGAYFVADKEALAVREIYSILAKAISAPVPFVLPEKLTPLLCNVPWVGRRARFFIKDRVFDISRILELGYSPKFKAQEALISSARSFYPVNLM
ncbi:MAG: NAD-dependent epimerase/dehydratase family protein [Candidatus Omnitrophota bacterium]